MHGPRQPILKDLAERPAAVRASTWIHPQPRRMVFVRQQHEPPAACADSACTRASAEASAPAHLNTSIVLAGCERNEHRPCLRQRVGQVRVRERQGAGKGGVRWREGGRGSLHPPPTHPWPQAIPHPSASRLPRFLPFCFTVAALAVAASTGAQPNRDAPSPSERPSSRGRFFARPSGALSSFTRVRCSCPVVLVVADPPLAVFVVAVFVVADPARKLPAGAPLSGVPLIDAPSADSRGRLDLGPAPTAAAVCLSCRPTAFSEGTHSPKAPRSCASNDAAAVGHFLAPLAVCSTKTHVS
mmetsp:Transcript_14390/g.32880  ORF Transcript_14390/g.32880 Transcript_14390/m.32880 type:complete len:299 (+) Transcript_14390:226-1122(+)